MEDQRTKNIMVAGDRYTDIRVLRDRHIDIGSWV